VEIGGVGFVGTKGFAGGFGRRMLGAFGEPAYKDFVGEAVGEALRLENALRTVRSERAMVVLHYAPVADTIQGEPLEIYPFLGSSRLAETIDRFKVSAIVHRFRPDVVHAAIATRTTAARANRHYVRSQPLSRCVVIATARNI
jgi:uncharacterized protein